MFPYISPQFLKVGYCDVHTDLYQPGSIHSGRQKPHQLFRGMGQHEAQVKRWWRTGKRVPRELRVADGCGGTSGRTGLFAPRSLEEAASSPCLPPPAFQPPASASTQSPTKPTIERWICSCPTRHKTVFSVGDPVVSATL